MRPKEAIETYHFQLFIVQEQKQRQKLVKIKKNPPIVAKELCLSPERTVSQPNIQQD